MSKRHRNTPEELAKAKAVYMAHPYKYPQREYAKQLGVSVSRITKWSHELKGTKPEIRPDVEVDMPFDEIANIMRIADAEVIAIYRTAMLKIAKILDKRNQLLIAQGKEPVGSNFFDSDDAKYSEDNISEKYSSY